MIKITPAILTSEPDNLRSLISEYLPVFDSIDIDIAEDEFVENKTVDLGAAISAVEETHSGQIVSWGWDLMIKEPQPAVDKLLDVKSEMGAVFRIYVHSKSNIEFLRNYKCHRNGIGVAVDGDEELKDISFYMDFAEVQLMGVISGKQGQEFIPGTIDKVIKLRQGGFAGTISIDGGVNLESAELIKNSSVDRVSVGSYFQDSENIQERFNELHKKLNHA